MKTKAEKEILTFCPSSRKAWRQWLKKNHRVKQSVWLIYYKKKSGMPTISWSEAVDEAVCFGWIDSTKKTIDEEKFMQFFCKRKPNSVWSKINKEKVERLSKDGLIAAAGYESIDTAKQNGSWIISDAAEAFKIPVDLEKEFKSIPGSKKYFLTLSKSTQKILLHWIVLAKKEDTRKNRISEVAVSAGQQLKPRSFR